MLRLLTCVGLLMMVPRVCVQAGTSHHGLADGKDIRVSYLAEEEGSLVLDKNGWNGYLASLLSALQSDMGFRIVETTITKSKANSNRYSDCVTDLTNNVTDMCLGSLWMTPGRSAQVWFSHPYDLANFRLLVRTVQESVSYFEQTFIPFEYEFWGLLVVVTIILAVALWVVERGGEELELDFRGCLHSWWLSVQGLLTGGVVHSPQTIAGKLISTGYTFLILIVLAAYTANLAAFLTVRKTGSQFKSLQDIAEKGAAVCMTKHAEPNVAARYPSVTVMTNVSDLASLDRFWASSEKEGCQALILKQSEFEAIQEGKLCSLQFVGESIFEIPIGLGLRVNLSWALEVNHYIDKYRFEGKLAEWITTHRKKMNCPKIDASDEDTSRLMIKQMIGGLVFCVIFLGLGCLVFVVQKLRKMQCKREKDPAQEESSQEQGKCEDEADKFEIMRHLSELLRATMEQQKSSQAEQGKCQDLQADKLESMRNFNESLRGTMEQSNLLQVMIEQHRSEIKALKERSRLEDESKENLWDSLRHFIPNPDGAAGTMEQNHVMQIMIEQHRSEIKALKERSRLEDESKENLWDSLRQFIPNPDGAVQIV